GELGRYQEDIGIIMVQAENKTTLERDAMLVQAADHLNIFFRRIEAFVILTKVFRRNGFQTHQQSFASASPGKLQKLRILRQQHRGKSIPLYLKGDKGGEKVARVFAVSNQIQVNKDELARAVL